uniref:Uncharacterized protein n=1 Tax=Cacopsylla melanoneura TaxID=428564 RepID=A0A8D9AQW8_9HEMI
MRDTLYFTFSYIISNMGFPVKSILNGSIKNVDCEKKKRHLWFKKIWLFYDDFSMIVLHCGLWVNIAEIPLALQYVKLMQVLKYPWQSNVLRLKVLSLHFS